MLENIVCLWEQTELIALISLPLNFFSQLGALINLQKGGGGVGRLLPSNLKDLFLKKMLMSCSLEFLFFLIHWKFC